MLGDPPKGLLEAERLSLIPPGRDDDERMEDEENPEGMAGYFKDCFEQERENPNK